MKFIREHENLWRKMDRAIPIVIVILFISSFLIAHHINVYAGALFMTNIAKETMILIVAFVWDFLSNVTAVQVIIILLVYIAIQLTRKKKRD